MQKNSKINWWVIIAILIIGIPVGYVATGVFQKIGNKDNVASVDSSTAVKMDTVDMTESIKEEKENVKEKEPVLDPVVQTEVVSKPEKVQEKQIEAPRPIPINKNDEEPSTPIKPQKLYTSVKPNSLAYGVNGGSKTINITSNTNWNITIIGDEGWLKTNTTNGNGNMIITVVAQENKMNLRRNATIVIKWIDQNDDERSCQIKASQIAYVPTPEPVTIAELQSAISSGKVDSRIPDNCKIVGNNIKTNYKQFRKNVIENKYESVKVESVSHDKKGNASLVKVTVVRPKPPVKDPVTTVAPPIVQKPVVSKEEIKPVVSKEEIQKIVASGQKNSKVSDGCTIVVNGRNTTDYQAFRQGVNYKVYSNVRVTDVTTDSSGKVTRIKVTAVESKDSE